MNRTVAGIALTIAGVMTFVLVSTLAGEFVDLGLAIVQLASEAVVIIGSLAVAAYAATADAVAKGIQTMTDDGTDR